MAKGAIAKQEVIEKIVEMFCGDAFVYNAGKEIRVNTSENGEPIQIKLAVTAAKTAVAEGDEDAVPGVSATTSITAINTTPAENIKVKATDEEKTAISNLMEELGL